MRLSQAEKMEIILRFNLEPYMTVLAATACLFHVPAFRLRSLPNCFPIGDLRLSNIGVHLEFAKEAVDDDFEM